jgi:hypothetical protein
MEYVCRGLVKPSYQAESLPQIVMKQCFIALSTTFYGLGNRRETMLHDGRREYLRALKMVNATIKESGCTGTKESLISIFALCLHEVR